MGLYPREQQSPFKQKDAEYYPQNLGLLVCFSFPEKTNKLHSQVSGVGSIKIGQLANPEFSSKKVIYHIRTHTHIICNNVQRHVRCKA